MKHIAIVIMFLLTASQTIVVPGAGAAEQANQPAAVDMKKQHQTMQTIGAQWSKAKQALAKGEFQAAEPALKKLIEVAPNVEKFQPHRNPEKRDQFQEQYKAFIASLDRLRSGVAAKDAAVVSDLIRAVDKTCNDCHAAFAGGHRRGR